MDAVVIEALNTLKKNINVSTGFTHPNDKGRTIELLRRLKIANYSLDSLSMKNWALENGFNSKDAEQLRVFVDGVNAGKAYRIGNQPYYKENIVEILEQSIK